MRLQTIDKYGEREQVNNNTISYDQTCVKMVNRGFSLDCMIIIPLKLRHPLLKPYDTCN